MFQTEMDLILLRFKYRQFCTLYQHSTNLISNLKKCLDRKRRHVSVEEQLCSCSLCQDVLKDPVSTRCGHWFCRQCITSYWDQSASSGDSSCPQCGKRSRTRPAGQSSSAQCKTLHLYQVKISPATCHSVHLKTYSQCIQPRGHKPQNHKNQAGTSAS